MVSLQSKFSFLQTRKHLSQPSEHLVFGIKPTVGKYLKKKMKVIRHSTENIVMFWFITIQ